MCLLPKERGLILKSSPYILCALKYLRNFVVDARRVSSVDAGSVFKSTLVMRAVTLQRVDSGFGDADGVFMIDTGNVSCHKRLGRRESVGMSGYASTGHARGALPSIEAREGRTPEYRGTRV